MWWCMPAASALRSRSKRHNVPDLVSKVPAPQKIEGGGRKKRKERRERWWGYIPERLSTLLTRLGKNHFEKCTRREETKECIQSRIRWLAC